MPEPDVFPKEKRLRLEQRRKQRDLLSVASYFFLSIQNMNNLVPRNAHAHLLLPLFRRTLFYLVSKEPTHPYRGERVILECVSWTYRARRCNRLIRNYIFHPEQTLRRLPGQPANTKNPPVAAGNSRIRGGNNEDGWQSRKSEVKYEKEALSEPNYCKENED